LRLSKINKGLKSFEKMIFFLKDSDESFITLNDLEVKVSKIKSFEK
jgi:hypothetical protein